MGGDLHIYMANMAEYTSNTWQVLIALIVDLPNIHLLYISIHLLYISISLPQSKPQESRGRDWTGNPQIAELAGLLSSQ